MRRYDGDSDNDFCHANCNDYIEISRSSHNDMGDSINSAVDLLGAISVSVYYQICSRNILVGGMTVTKTELEQYRSIVTELDEIRDRINRDTVHGVVTGSYSEFPYVQHHILVGGVTESRQSNRDMRLYRELKRRISEIEIFVASIPDSVTRRIFRYRYMDGAVRPSWQWIAFKIGGNNTADSVRMIHSRFLKKNIFS